MFWFLRKLYSIVNSSVSSMLLFTYMILCTCTNNAENGLCMHNHAIQLAKLKVYRVTVWMMLDKRIQVVLITTVFLIVLSLWTRNVAYIVCGLTWFTNENYKVLLNFKHSTTAGKSSHAVTQCIWKYHHEQWNVQLLALVPSKIQITYLHGNTETKY